MLKNKSLKKRIFIFLCFLAYIGCVGVLIFESCMNSKVSSEHSNAVGGIIKDTVNDAAGDQTETVIPTSAEILSPITQAYVGDTYQVNVKTLPENATYKSYSFYSSNEEIASIDESGLVTFNSVGEVDISVVNNDYVTVATKITITVLEIEATSISSIISYIDSGKNECNKDGYNYVLKMDNMYYLDTVFTPQNVTYKDIEYIYDEQYIEINLENNKIIPKKAVTTAQTIVVKHKELTYTINYVVDEMEIDIVDLEAINVKNKTLTLTLNQKISNFTSSAGITFTPSNATYKTYKLKSSNTSIVKVSGTTITAIGYGSAKITITSTENSEIVNEVIVNVKPIDITSFTLSITNKYNGMLEVGKSAKIQIKSPKPTNATAYLNKKYQKIETDSPYVTVDSSGNIKSTLEAAGSKVTFTVTLYNTDESGNITDSLVQTTSVVFFVPSGVDDFDFTLDFNGKSYTQADLDNEKLVVYTNVDVPYSASITDYYFNGSKLTNITEIKTAYKVIFDDEYATVTTNSVMFTSTPRVTTISIVLTEYNIIKTFEIYVIESIEYKKMHNENEILPAQLEQVEFNGKYYPLLTSDEIFVGLHYDMYFGNDYDDYRYKLAFSSEKLIVNENDGYKLCINTTVAENINILVTPVINNIELTEYSMVVSLKVNERIIDDFTFEIHDFEDNNIDLIPLLDENNNIVLDCYKKDIFYLSYSFIPWETPSLVDMEYINSNKKVAKLSNGQLEIIECGQTTITVIDNISGKSKTIIVKAQNVIKFDQDSSYELLHEKLKYDVGSDVYHITNGISGRIKTYFSEDSTYKKVQYTSSNTEVFKVSNDGVITPVAPGVATLTATIDDGYSEVVTYSITIEVERTDFITDLTQFFRFIRKGLGHFSAFLIMGIFSTLFYLLAFDNKKWLFSVPVNIFQGWFVGALTEYIQLHVPGRAGAWSDVWLDFSGFLTSALIISACILITALIKKLKKVK